MNYKLTIENADNFNSVLMTQNGFPIYDVMIPTRDHYCTASGLVFYTEDENLLKEFKDLDTVERKEFLIKNIQYIKPLKEILEKSPEMSHPMPLAYNHLLHDFERTIRQANYGCAHLVIGDELLIFHQSQVFSKLGYKINNHKEFNDLYDEIENLIAKAYKEGKIEPDGIISGKALDRLKSKNPEIFKEMTKNQNNVLEILKGFKFELLDHCRLTYDKNDELVVHLEVSNKVYDITIPKHGKSNLELVINHERQEFKNVNDLIDSIYSDVTHNKLKNFKTKMKM